MTYKIFVQLPTANGRRGVFRCEADRPNGGQNVGWGYTPHEAWARAYDDDTRRSYLPPDDYLIEAAYEWGCRDTMNVRWVSPFPNYPFKVPV